MAEPKTVMAQNKTHETIICYASTMITTNGIWQGDNPLDYSLPLFILQLILVISTTRILVFILKPLRQPRVVSEILGGVILGPSVLGKSPSFARAIFPLRSVMVLETMANVGLLYFLFLVGVEMDIGVVRRTGKKSLTIAAAGMALPFVVGAGFSFVARQKMQQTSCTLYLGIALSVTAFPVLARILAELKLINTELGRMAMSTGLICDVFAWILLAIAIAVTEGAVDQWATVWVILSSICFVAFCFLVVRPSIYWIIRRNPEGASFNELHISLILTGVLIAGFITDLIGTHAIFGAFVFGLIIPNGPLGLTLIEKLEDFISGLLLPLFFANSGLKTDIAVLSDANTWGMLFVIIVLAITGKVVGTLITCRFYHMSVREGVALGLLLNTKGLIEIIILNLGRDQKVLDDRSFTTMVVTAVIMTGLITPLAALIYRPGTGVVAYKLRTIQREKPHSELRIMVCVHTPKNVPSIINLLEATHPSKKSPMYIYVLHLVELTGRASAMLIVHNNLKAGRPALSRTQVQSDHIIHTFENFEQQQGCVSINPLTAISPYSTMHEDICTLAEDKRIAFIIIPFHKQQTVDGGLEAVNPALRTVNQNLLATAPCSVAIFVDRGFSAMRGPTTNPVAHRVALLFFGGPDDREALVYASRMCEQEGMSLTMMRFVAGEKTDLRQDSSVSVNEASKALTVEIADDRDKQLDEDIIAQFRSNFFNNKSVVYTEKVVNNAEQTVAGVRSIDHTHDLFIVGRGQGTFSPLTAGLTDWSECPELGPIGDLLASSDFAASVSVLVVQQYVRAGVIQDLGVDTPDVPDDRYHYRQSQKQKPIFSP